MTEAEKAYQYFVIAVPENEEQAKAYFWARKALQSTLTPPNEPERAGLYGKYTVYKNKDGSLVTDCFILRPAKDPAAVAALRAYAATTDNAELAADIINWVGAEPNEPLTLEQLREINGEPIYVTTKNYGDGWCILNWHGVNKSYTYFSRTGTSEGMTATPLSAKTYGDLWLAYRRPPEGEEDT